MAHSSRPHPYRATSRVDTPQGPRTAAWLAGHRGLPGDVDPPPYRPVLILIDYSPLQDLTHRSEPDRDRYMAIANSNLKNVSAGELEALFTWSRQLEPIEAGILPIRDLRTAITKRLRTQWDIQFEPSNLEFRYGDLEGDASKFPMIGPSCSFWKNTVLIGESGSTTTSNPPCSCRVLHSLSYYV